MEDDPHPRQPQKKPRSFRWILLIDRANLGFGEYPVPSRTPADVLLMCSDCSISISSVGDLQPNLGILT